MNAKITIALCGFVAMINQAGAAIVDADTELRAFAISTVDWVYPDHTDTDEKWATFSGYGSSSVSAEAVLNYPDLLTANAHVRASVQPHAIHIGTSLSLSGSPVGPGREGTGTASVNFNLSEAGVWSAKPVLDDANTTMQEAEVSLLRDGQEVYRQDCSGSAILFCFPGYNPDYVGTSLELQQGNYTLLLTAANATFSNRRVETGFAVDLQLVPVPAALPLFLSGLAALGFLGWRRR